MNANVTVDRNDHDLGEQLEQDVSDIETAFRYMLNQDINHPGLMQSGTLVIHPGPRAWKAARLLVVGDKQTGVASRDKLIFEQYSSRRDGIGGYAFDEKPEHRFQCQGSEITALKGLLEESYPETGTYVRIDNDALPAAVLHALREGALTGQRLIAVIKAVTAAPELADELADSEGARLLAEIVEQRRRRTALDQIEAVVNDASSTEHDLQKALEDNWWIFGGQYVDMETRRRLTTEDIVDIPLVRAD